MSDPKIRIGSIAEFRPQRRNVNRHTLRGAGMLEKSMRSDGFVAPITTAANGEAIDGSLRLEEAAEVFGDEVLVVEHDGTRPIVMKRVDIPTAETPQAVHIGVAANRIAEIDYNPDPSILAELQAENEQLLNDLYHSEELDELVRKMQKDGAAGEANTMEQVESELPGVASLKDYALFKSSLPYDIPELLPGRCWTDPLDIQVWAGPTTKYPVTKAHWLYIWGSDSIRGLDLEHSLVGFYTDDYRFENFWYKPAEYTGKLINAHVMGAVMPNFSMYWELPRAVRIWQKYRSNWCARYFQEAGIPVLPDVQMSPEDGELCWMGVPKGVPISMQFHVKLDEDNWNKKLAFCQTILDALDPPWVLAYANTLGWSKIKDAGWETRMVWVPSRVMVRQEYMRNVKKEVI